MEGLVRLAGFVLVSFDTILMSFLSDVGVILVSSGCLSATLGLPRTPRGGRAEKVAEKVSFGSSPGTPFEVQIDKELKKVVPRSTLERTVRKVLHKSCPGIPSNHGNNGFVYTKPWFSHFHLELLNNRKGCPMGTPLAPLGMPWASFWLFGRFLGTALDFHGFWDSPWPPPGKGNDGVGG